MHWKTIAQATSLTLLLGFTAVTAQQTWRLLQDMPFTAPLLSDAQLHRALTQAMANTLTPEMVSARLHTAIAADDRTTAQIYADLSHSPDDLRAFQSYSAHKDALITRASDCLACTWDAKNCDTLSQMLMCKGPILLTPVEDVAVLSGAGVDALQGEDVDELDVALALVGLGATGLVIFTGGSSYSLKLGASAIRAAKRMGTLTDGMQASLRSAARIPINWGKASDVALARAPLSQMVDPAHLAPLAAMARDAARLRDATSAGEALHLLRYADDAAELRALTRVAEATGPEARTTFEVLGKSRILRIAARLSDEVIGAMTGLFLLFGQIGSLLGTALMRSFLHILRKSLAR